MSAVRRARKLTVDVTTLLDEQWTGIPVFTRRLIRALQANESIALDFACDMVRLPAAKVEAALSLGAGSPLRETLEAELRGAAAFVDLDAPIYYPSNKTTNAHLKREASTVHDISTLVMPETHDETNVAHHLDRFEEELDTDEAVFCISQATRAALVTARPSIAPKTRLIYQYVDWPEQFRWLERNAPKLRLGRYAVIVGTVEPRKNLSLILKALAMPRVANTDIHFIVIGKKGWRVDGFMENLTREQRERVRFFGFVTEFVKYRLIANAEFLVFPSLYEGFGIPALEAMSLGKPVLASRSSSLPEVVGDAGLFFDPLSVEEFAEALAEISHPRRLAELSPLAFAQSAKFGPERMAAPVLEWVTEG